jgi:hypothetical protein
LAFERVFDYYVGTRCQSSSQPDGRLSCAAREGAELSSVVHVEKGAQEPSLAPVDPKFGERCATFWAV